MFYYSILQAKYFIIPNIWGFGVLGFWIANSCTHLNLVPLPTVMAARGISIRVQVPHVVLARKLGYARSDAVVRSIKGLQAKGYITYCAGTGTKGQEKNISRFSVFKLLIPENYDLPRKRNKLPENVALGIAKSTLVTVAGVDLDDVNVLIANGLTRKAIATAKAKPPVKNYLKYYINETS